MKEYITEDQWNELSKTGKENLDTWYLINFSIYRKPNDKAERFLSVGQMIQYLYQYQIVSIESEERESSIPGWSVNQKYHSVELCDALWMAVKEVLRG